MLDEISMLGEKTWEYPGPFQNSAFLGDAERLPNGNVLVTHSVVGVIEEVDPSGAVVQSFTGTTFGYSDVRTSLHGPPSR